jgi:hypothetical protein
MTSHGSLIFAHPSSCAANGAQLSLCSDVRTAALHSPRAVARFLHLLFASDAHDQQVSRYTEPAAC